MEDSPHNGDRLGSGGGGDWVGVRGLKSVGLGRRVGLGGVEVGGVGVGDWGELGTAYAQILGHIRCVANLLCGESFVANLLWRMFHVVNPLATFSTTLYA